jgi:predicted GIY-YIG superfamily endonuclease
MTELGLYILSHTATGVFYIGSSINVERRMKMHQHRLNHGIHHAKKLQEVYSTDQCLAISIIPFDTLDQARKAEQELIGLLGHSPLLSNTLHSGRPMADETKEKIRNSDRGLKGMKRSEETCRRIALARTGQHHSEETKLKVSLANKGRKMNRTSEHCDNIAKSLMKSVSIVGIIYDSGTEAAVINGCSLSTLMRRCRGDSPKFKDWLLLE